MRYMHTVSRRRLHALARQDRQESYGLQPETPTRRPVSSSAPLSVASNIASSSSSPVTQHLNGVFKPLEFPPDVALRILTHLSHKDALAGHNARFSFMGRRVLDSYLLLFLHSLPASLISRYDYERTSERVINSYVLGEHVAPQWGLPSVMRWSPAQFIEEGRHLGPKELRSVGLHKVAGTTVEAVMGGIFHQFGGSVAHRVFHTRLLPHIMLPGQPEGLPDPLHKHAQAACEKMGGVSGPLLVAEGKR
ncbi:hypothetical protein BV25DRAFT_1961305 [Artomyces pyxidatus]|uniref:Uncharacterized protein n=1 Tax=Artomyces pyxidatus TaxID=48021 RepID=A0ACB8SU18_9AGAM|nr:hypothetical protein BV25DRAFT_1961305 [Artomyces pyxidatus]